LPRHPRFFFVRTLAILFGLVSSPLFGEESDPAPIPGIDAADGADGEEAKEETRQSEVLPTRLSIQEKYKTYQNADYRLDKVAKVGEKLTYLVKWKGVPAGTAELEVKRETTLRDRPVYVVELHNQTNDFLSLLYDVDSRVRSFIDVDNGRSHLFKRSGKEGPRTLDDRIEFDYARLDEAGAPAPSSVYVKMKKGQPQEKPARPIPGPLQDSLSIIYYLRSLDFGAEGTSHPVLVGSRKRTDVATVHLRGSERITLPKIGTFDCLKVEPRGDAEADRSNIVVSKGTATFWLEKHTRIPLMATVDIPVGSISLSLIKAEQTTLLDHAVSKADP